MASASFFSKAILTNGTPYFAILPDEILGHVFSFVASKQLESPNVSSKLPAFGTEDPDTTLTPFDIYALVHVNRRWGRVLREHLGPCRLAFRSALALPSQQNARDLLARIGPVASVYFGPVASVYFGHNEVEPVLRALLGHQRELPVISYPRDVNVPDCFPSGILEDYSSLDRFRQCSPKKCIVVPYRPVDWSAHRFPTVETLQIRKGHSLESFPSLRALSILSPDSNALDYALPLASQLETLHFQFVRHDLFATFSHIPQFTCLSSLTMSYAILSGTHAIPSGTLRLLAAHCPLKQLALMYCPIGDMDEPLTFPHLESFISLEARPALDLSSLRMPRLVSLAGSFCYVPQRPNAAPLSDIAPQLRRLTVDSLTENLADLVRSCPLEVLRAKRVEGASLRRILTGPSRTTLQELQTSCTFSQDEICSLARASPQLRSLNLSGCEEFSFSDHTIRTICEHIGRSLTQLHLYGDGEQVTDRSLDMLATHCPYLTSLSLSEVRITVGGINTYVPRMRRMEPRGCHIGQRPPTIDPQLMDWVVSLE